jgi:hypothetical protein
MPSLESMYGYMVNMHRNIVKQFRRIRLNTVTRIAPKRYIGVGYKDKGNLLSPSYDNSPSWQSVAMTQEHSVDYFVTICSTNLRIRTVRERINLLTNRCEYEVQEYLTGECSPTNNGSSQPDSC